MRPYVNIPLITIYQRNSVPFQMETSEIKKAELRRTLFVAITDHSRVVGVIAKGGWSFG